MERSDAEWPFAVRGASGASLPPAPSSRDFGLNHLHLLRGAGVPSDLGVDAASGGTSLPADKLRPDGAAPSGRLLDRFLLELIIRFVIQLRIELVAQCALLGGRQLAGIYISIVLIALLVLVLVMDALYSALCWAYLLACLLLLFCEEDEQDISPAHLHNYKFLHHPHQTEDH